MIRLGIVGAGRHSTAAHGPALKILKSRRPEEIKLAAVCDLDLERAESFATEFGFRRVYSEIDDMLAGEDLDALLAITPLNVTEEVAARLLPLGIPLLIEKPPGTTSEACRHLLDLASRHETPHMISFNRRFNPAVLRAQEWIAEDPKARGPRLILGRMVRHARREPDFAVGTGIHLIDVVLGILGRPQRVTSQKLDTATPGCFSFSAHLQFAGTAAHIAISPSSGAREESMEIHGADYLLKIDTFHNRIELHQDKNVAWRWKPGPGTPPELLDVIAETDAFLHGVRTGADMRPNLADGLLSLQIAETIQRGEDFPGKG